MKYILIVTIMITAILTANGLKDEQSPYLQQHADNPVAWMPWSKATLEKAKKEGRLIFLSIGYSTCHWCHVMEEESFEKQEVADVLQKDYIAIKVDREEMPQLDSYYQNVYQVMNGRGGGWPLTIIMTPEAKPFWSATYLPEKNLISVATDIATIYKNEKNRITEATREIEALMKQQDKQKSHNEDSDLKQVTERFKNAIKGSFDEMSGGFGAAPKFPRATLLEAMLDLYALEHDKQLLVMVEATLNGMAEGGIYDQIESGFYRYSVDGQWHIPHFEKMLYTQAELLRVYTKAYLLTHNEKYKTVVDDLIAFVNKRFDKEHLLYSASDADSLTAEGDKEEGYYFVFEYSKTLAFLKSSGYTDGEAKAILSYFNITKNGNFENSNTNPNIQGNKPIQNLEKIKNELAKLRSQKPYPFIDKKILTAWNSMYTSALIQAAKIDPSYGKEAIIRLDTLLAHMFKEGTLYHQKLHGKQLKVLGLFEDYAFLIDALVDAYTLKYDKKYITLAQKLAKKAIEKFYDNGSWNLSDDVYRTKSPLYDSAYASPASVMTRALFKLSLQTDDLAMRKIASISITQNPRLMRSYPDSIATAFDTFLGYKTEYKILKSTKSALLENKKTIEALNDPYLLTKAIALDTALYLGCSTSVCFATDSNLTKVLQSIKER